MKAITNTAPGELKMLECPIPAPGAGQVLVRTLAVGICATDLEMIAGWDRTPAPAICGHEWCGRVEGVGPEVDETLLSSLCVAENVLADGGEVGFEHPGGYAEYFLTEAANVRPLPDGFSPATATLIEPLAVTVRGMNRLGSMDIGGSVLVMGDGPIGLLSGAMLAMGGFEDLTLVGGRDNRLEIAARLGVGATVNYHTGDMPACEGGFDIVIEASGSAAAMSHAVASVSAGGRVLVLGDYAAAAADFRWNDLLHREITLIGSNASAGAWEQAVEIAIAAPHMLESLISHRLPAAEFAEGMRLMQDRAAGAVKVVLEW